MEPAPVIFFAYSRYQTTLKSLTSLSENDLAGESTLYIFADGPKTNASAEKREDIRRTREVLKSRQWCKNVYIEESETNKGLANSVIRAVSSITEKYGKAIIVEDDALLSPYFLRFMNDSLNTYENDEKVFGVGGWTYFMPPGKSNTPFFLRYPDSLCWAVYRRSWQHFIHDPVKARKLLLEKKLNKNFNPFKEGLYFDAMLDDQIHGKIDSWAIRWTATTVIHNALIIYPHISMARNLGNTDGTHEQVEDYNADLPIATAPVTVERPEVKESDVAFREWKRFTKKHFLNYDPVTELRKTLSAVTPAPLKKIARTLLKRGKGTDGISLNNLLDTDPVSRVFGFDRGKPIDRYYIEHFLKNNSQYIKGKVMEIGDSTYSRQFDNGVTSFEVLGYQASDQATVIGDLTDHATLPENSIDCFICTQTLNMIYDFRSAMQGCYRALKPGGVLLMTVAGICQISQYDNARWGDYWRFTPLSIQKTASELFGSDMIEVRHFGNSYAAILMLKGYASEEADQKKLDVSDPDYPVLITLTAIKKHKIYRA